MKKSFLITPVSILLFFALNLVSLAQVKKKSLADIKEFKKIHQLNAGIKAKATCMVQEGEEIILNQ